MINTLSIPNFYWYTDPGTGAKSKTNNNYYNVNQAIKDITLTEGALSFTYIPDFATGIKGVKVRECQNDDRIYTLDGRYVGKDEMKLPKGLYIKNHLIIKR